MIEYVRLNTDMWEDAGKVYRIVEYMRRPNSTGVSLVLENAYKPEEVIHRVVAEHQIEYLEAKDW